jgi:hypothetical protein
VPEREIWQRLTREPRKNEAYTVEPPIWDHLKTVKMTMMRMIHGGRGKKRGGFGEEEEKEG